MMKLLRSKSFWLLIVAACAAVWGGSRAYQTHQINEAKAMSEDLFKPEKPQPKCVGRMLLELPKGAQMLGSLYQYPGVNQKIEESPNVTQAEFEKTVHEFEEHLRNTKHEKDPSLLKSVTAVPSQDGAKVFLHWGYTFDAPLVSITGLRWEAGVQYRFTSETDLDSVSSGVDEMTKLLAGMRRLPQKEIPIEHGFCLNTAFIPDSLTGEWLEQAEASFDVKPYADVSFTIETTTNHVKPPDTLLDRLKTMPQRFPSFAKALSTIRSGKRTVGQLDGEEVLVSVTDDEGKKFFQFEWEVEGALKRNDPPNVHLQLRVGKRHGQPELTQVQAMALWEYLLAHLRLRPTTELPKKVSEAPSAPLGELVATGRTCPQSGWWECAEEARPVQGSRRQFFRSGDRMPHAVLQGEPNVWQKLKGETPTHRVATVWKLVDYDAPPATDVSPAATNVLSKTPSKPAEPDEHNDAAT